MRKKISLIIIILFLSSCLFGQKTEPLTLIDEFGAINLDDLMARLDIATVGLHSELSQHPNSKMRVRIYGGIADSYASAYYNGSIIESYLKSNRRLKLEEFSIEYCNVNKEELRTQIYIVSQDGQLSRCEENLEVPTKTIRFSTSYFYFKNFKFVPIEDSIIDLGPSAGDYSRAAFKAMKNLLENSPESEIYVFSYLQVDYKKDETGKMTNKKADKKSLASKLLQTAKRELIKNGFEPSRIKFIEGGYTSDDERRLEFWFVPKDGEIPKPKPDYFPKKKQSK